MVLSEDCELKPTKNTLRNHFKSQKIPISRCIMDLEKIIKLIWKIPHKISFALVMMMLLSNNSLLSPFRNENDTGIIWIDQFKNYEGLESTFEKLTIESKILLVYMAIVCALFLSALITIVCCRSPIFKDENTTLNPTQRSPMVFPENSLTIQNTHP